ncbi:hypothetical protein EVC24_029 [Rhizobium phage RHph_I4]|nr:hypothetical protein EVC24_029 [Rhizobium phage RHph_I4]
MQKINSKGGSAFVRSTFARAAADTNDIQALSAGTAKRYALKTGAEMLEFHFDVTTAPVYAKFGNSTVTAAVPVADDITGGAPIIIRSGQTLAVPVGATHVSLIAAGATVVSIASFAL